MVKNNWKRYLVSSALTFLTGFALVMVSEIDSLSIDSLKSGAWVGVAFTAVRAGVKALLELFLVWRKK